MTLFNQGLNWAVFFFFFLEGMKSITFLTDLLNALGQIEIWGHTHSHSSCVYQQEGITERGSAIGSGPDWRLKGLCRIRVGVWGWEMSGGEGFTAYLCSIITSKLAHTHRCGETCSWPSTALLEGPEVLACLSGCAQRLQVTPVERKSLFCFQGSQLDVCV